MAPYIAPEVDSRVGFWGKATSTLDWCEENYALSELVAEFWNTVSNVFLIILPLLGIYRCQRDRVEARYTLAYLSGLAVGLGSIMFHATLLYEMQLLDEISMLIASVVMIFCLIEINTAHNVISAKGYIAIAFLSLYATLVTIVSLLNVTMVTIVYLFIHDPTFHEVAYGILVFVLTVLGFYVLWKYAQFSYLKMSCLSIGIYLFGFLLWNIDNHFCSSIRELRKTPILSLAGFVTQLHAWWHILTAIGYYLHILVSSRVRMDLLGHNTSVKMCLGMPYLVVHRKKRN